MWGSNRFDDTLQVTVEDLAHQTAAVDVVIGAVGPAGSRRRRLAHQPGLGIQGVEQRLVIPCHQITNGICAVLEQDVDR
jgi:hypothetical protein